ncbi:MAG: threonylcarbamoyl-AMP synthase [Ignavibacteria bacterium]|nr:threonylcarbamoyl-AMP synthase [Ignavibacteria bacterium]
MTKITKNIDTAVKEIIKGNVIALPTETVYGLCANALNINAVLKIFKIKNRPKFNPLIVHLYNIEQSVNYVKEIPSDAIKLMEKFIPGPITFVLKKKRIIPDIVTAGLDTVAIRFPSKKVFRDILRILQLPIAAPSANIFGKISPVDAKDVYNELRGKINYIFDGGKCEIGIESTVVGFQNDEVYILRHGYITKEKIEKTIGKKVTQKQNVISQRKTKILSPGMLLSHYSPDTPLYITKNISAFEKIKNEKEKINIQLKRGEIIKTEIYSHDIGLLNLSIYGSYEKAASNLFSNLRKLDKKGYKIIVTELLENRNLGTAINERLIKASLGTIEINQKSF